MNAVVEDVAPRQESREPGISVFLGVLPFLLIGAAMTLVEIPGGLEARRAAIRLGMTALLGGYIVILAGVVVGWVSGFPRWVMPYLFFAVLFSWYLSNVTTPGLTVFGIPIWGREGWGWRAWVPLAAVILLAAALSRSLLGSLKQLVRALREDWTLVAFGSFGMLPMIIVFMDEIAAEFSFPVVFFTQLLLMLGALLYMVLPEKGRRFQALLISAALASLLVGISTDYYWQQYNINFATGQKILKSTPPDMLRALSSGVNTAAVALLFFLFPVIVWYLGFVRFGGKKT